MNFSVFWFRSLHPERLHYRRRIASTNIITLVLNSSSTMLVLMHPILWFPTLFIRFIFLVISYVQRVHTIPVAPDWLQQISNGKPHSQLLFNCSLSNCNFRWIFFSLCRLLINFMSLVENVLFVFTFIFVIAFGNHSIRVEKQPRITKRWRTAQWKSEQHRDEEKRKKKSCIQAIEHETHTHTLCATMKWTIYKLNHQLR